MRRTQSILDSPTGEAKKHGRPRSPDIVPDEAGEGLEARSWRKAFSGEDTGCADGCGRKVCVCVCARI